MDSMEKDTAKEGEQGSQEPEQTAVADTVQGSQADAQTEVKFLSLTEMSEEMFSTADVKKFFILAKILGSKGEVPATIPDVPAEIMAAKVLDSMSTFRNFQGQAEIFFNAILQRTIKEEELDVNEEKLLDACGNWITHCTNPAFIGEGKKGDGEKYEARKEIAREALKKILEANIFGEEKKRAGRKLMQKGQNFDTFKFIGDITREYGPIDDEIEQVTAESRKVFETAPFTKTSQAEETSSVKEAQETAEVPLDLPAVLIVDKDGNVMEAHPFIGQIIKIGTANLNDIVLPSNGNYKRAHAAVLQREGVFEVLGTKDSLVRFKGLNNQFIANSPVEVDPNRILYVGEGESAIYFMLTTSQRFEEQTVQESFGNRLLALEQEFESVGGSNKTLEQKERQLKKLQRETATITARFSAHKAKSFGILLDETQTLAERIQLALHDVERKKQMEYEANLPAKSHFDKETGETFETPRPYKYGVVIPVGNENNDQLAMDVAFPGLFFGKLDIIEEGLELTKNGIRYRYENDHEFTEKVIKSYIQKNLPNIIDILFYSDDKKVTDKKQVHEVLAHFLETGLVDQSGLNAIAERMGREKLRETKTIKAGSFLRAILTREKTLGDFIVSPGFREELPYDAISFLIASNLMNSDEVDWEKVQFPESASAHSSSPRDKYGELLTDAAGIRLEAYDTRLVQIRNDLSSTGQKLWATVSGEKQQQLENIKLEYRKILIEIITLMEIGVTNLQTENEKTNWFMSRHLSKEELEQVQGIAKVQRTVQKLKSEEDFTAQEIKEALAIVQRKSYRDFFNFEDVDPQSRLRDFILDEVKTHSVKSFQKASAEEKFGTLLYELEELIKAGALQYEDLNTTQAGFQDLRANEIYFEKLAKGKQSLATVVAETTPNLEAIISVGKQLHEGEIALIDEDEETFHTYTAQAFRNTVGDAKAGNSDRTKVAMMVNDALANGLLGHKEIDTTPQDLDAFCYFDALNLEEKKLSEKVHVLAKQVETSGVHVLAPLLELKTFLDHYVLSPIDGKHSEEVMQEVFAVKCKRIMDEALKGFEDENSDLLEMLQLTVKELQELGFQQLIEKYLAKKLFEALEILQEENPDEEKMKDIRVFLKSLDVLDMSEMATPLAEKVVRHFVEQMGHESEVNAEIIQNVLHVKLVAAGFKANV